MGSDKILPQYRPHEDFAAVQRYLSGLAGACAEGATNPDPRVTLLAMAVVSRAARELGQ